MLRYRKTTYSHEITRGFQSPEIENNLKLQCSIQKAKRSLIWGFINACVLAVVIYDLTYKCPIYTTYFNYFEYGFIVISALNILYHIIRYFTIVISVERLKMMSTAEAEKNKKVENESVLNTQQKSPTSPNLNSSSLSNQSWRSHSPNDSRNYSISSPSWVYFHGSPKGQQLSPSKNYIPDDDTDYIADEKMLKQYLYDYEAFEKVSNMNNSTEQNSNLLSNFWNNATSHMQHDNSMFIKKQPYLISQATSATDLANATRKKNESSPLNIAEKGGDIWKKLQIDAHTLTQWNANLRMWISQTILERLVEEITSVNAQLQSHHLNDVIIGIVGLERLRKTAQTEQAQQYTPTLAALIPFLEVTTNQEYFVLRLKELVKGGCMSEFRWNSGGAINGKPWDDSLPTDSEIVMHCLSTYLDSQLMPLPNQPEAKPFSKEHFIKMDEKVPQSPLTLAINQVSYKPPVYRVIVGEEIYETVKGHNNLLHTILLFLYFVSKKEHGMLGKVNMGKSGVNMLWIIDR